ncbi:MAG: Two-component hybrid sensor and regulator [Candidatus Uhrbacteria bacterium GW2011_GWE2_46_68]|uniref:histidine kinase n=2 Tax=Candidatus Uhriibacteriota TaxID=1752732 RepID=A0A0G1Q9T4_9BACT|nr:MAG: Two-component hybrid sensor and regulator [Candidatus Uhrbacteria bacterium GW2011_GWF2_46_218]KKU41816.1 MAG: Two-component hybrid sensor and regulator [Candidatus Uhrbacteria bacterium GW2011_GWE2_46_68]
MFRFFFSRITRQLEFFLLLFILVPLLCLSIFFIFQARGNSHDTSNFLAYSVLINKSRVQEILNAYESGVETLALDLQVHENFFSFLSVHDEESFSVLDLLGREDISGDLIAGAAFLGYQDNAAIVTTNGFTFTQDEVHAFASHKTDGRETKTTFLFRNSGTNDLSILLSYPFEDEQSLFSGFLIIEIKPSSLLELEKNFRTLSQTGEMQIVSWGKNGNAQTILPSRFINASVVSSITSDSLYAKVLKRNGFLDRSIVDYRGKSVFAASRYLPTHELGLIVKMDRQEVLEPLIILAGSLTLIAVFLLFFGFVFISYFSSIVAKPLEDLAEAARRIEKGETDIRLPHTDAKNEIGVMTRAFRRMTTSLIESNEALEEKVHNRTAELQKNFSLIKKEKAKDDALLSSIGEGLVVVDAKGLIIMVNRAAESIFTLRSDRMVGKQFSSVIVLLDKDNHVLSGDAHPVLSTLLTAKKANRMEFLSKRSNQDIFPIALTSAPILLSGKVTGSVIIIRDITREKEIDRMKSEFISIASHQLRGPVASIKWYGELLGKETSRMKESTKEFVNRINVSTVQLVALIDDFLNVSRIESNTVARTLEDIEPYKLVQNIVETYRHDIEEKGLKLTIKNLSKVKSVSFDPESIREIYANIIANAIKYTKDRGDIFIRLFDRGVTLMLEAKDTGEGIPRDEQSKIFTKFYRASNVLEGGHKGTGLGLYTAHLLAKQAGGDITFISAKGKGSTFTVSLPRKQKTLSKN